MSTKTLKQQLKQIEEERILRDQIANTTRARSISVGTAFGGTTEVSMRCDDGRTVWSLLQPVEVIELIHQLSANVGCHVALKPRKDFASWRDWRVTEEEQQRLGGWAPFVNDMAPYNQLGAQGMDSEIIKALDAGAQLVETGGGAGGLSAETGQTGQPGANVFDVEKFNRSKKNAVATEKPKDRRSAKRAAKTA